MVLTLWLSSKSKSVVQTSIDLSSQNTTKERFQPNAISRGVVRLSIGVSDMVSESIPKNIRTKIDKQFDQAKGPLTKIALRDRPAFDMVRAAVNLMVASVLISIATSMKLPLSTTYVTFMVAMGPSLADRAWGAESAVYRVAGVLNVIAGWFFTALVAFTVAGFVAFLMHLNVQIMFPVLLFTALGLLINSSIRYKKKSQLKQSATAQQKSESRSVQGVINESANTIAKVLSRGARIYSTTIFALAQQDLVTLKKNKKQVVKLSDEIDALRDDIFYFIRSLDDASVGASNFYIQILGSLQDMTQSLNYITKLSHKHVNNNHKKLKFNQIKELSEISQTVKRFFEETKQIFEIQAFDKSSSVVEQKTAIDVSLKRNIDSQVLRTRNEDSSPKNTTLYFSLLIETKDLMNAIAGLVEEYNTKYNQSLD
jgi:Na+/phosphate symporter